MDVLIIGGSGFIGRHLASHLVDIGHAVTVFSRTPDPRVLPSSVETIAGNVTTYEDVNAAIAYRDAVINLASLSPLFQPKGGEKRHDEITLGGTRNIVRAMEEHGTDRLLYQSGLGAAPDAPTPYLRAKGRAEGVVQSSELHWTITRPSIVFGEGSEFLEFTKALTTPYVTGLPGGGDIPFQPIFIDDLTTAFGRILADPTHHGAVYELGGPEILTFAEITKAIYRAEGKSVRILPVPMTILRIGSLIAGPVPVIPFGPAQYRSLQLTNTTKENAIGRLGVPEAELTTLSAYLERDRE